jgi:pentatricopeptide repeat protein
MAKAAKISPFRLASLLRIEKNPQAALDLFRNPPTSKPCPRNARLYDIIVCKLAKARLFSDVEQVLDEMRLESRFAAKEVLFCRVITLCGRACLPGPAADIYRRIPSFRCKRTVRSFNTLLHVLLECGDVTGVRSLLGELDGGELTPDTCTYNILIRMCASSKSLENAWDLFDEMRRRGLRPSIITFGTLIPLLFKNSILYEAYELREEMERTYNIKPNVYINTSFIKAHCNMPILAS